MIGFLSPKGTFFECESYEHIYYAKQICKDYYSYNAEHGVAAEDYLLSKGWIVFRTSDVYNNRKGSITDEQINFINCSLTEIVTNHEIKDSLSDMLLWDKDIKMYGN